MFRKSNVNVQFNNAPIGTLFVLPNGQRARKVRDFDEFILVDIERWIRIPIPEFTEIENLPKGIRRNGRGFQARYKGENLGTFPTIAAALEAYKQAILSQ